MADLDFAPEVWQYAGRRCDRSGKLTDRWQAPDGEKGFTYDQRQRYIIGASYTVPVAHEPDGHTTAKLGLAEQVDDPVLEDQAQAQAWRLDDRAAIAEQEQIRATKRAIRESGDIGSMTLEQVRESYWKILPHQRSGLIAAVLEYLR